MATSGFAAHSCSVCGADDIRDRTVHRCPVCDFDVCHACRTERDEYKCDAAHPLQEMRIGVSGVEPRTMEARVRELRDGLAGPRCLITDDQMAPSVWASRVQRLRRLLLEAIDVVHGAPADSGGGGHTEACNADERDGARGKEKLRGGTRGKENGRRKRTVWKLTEFGVSTKQMPGVAKILIGVGGANTKTLAEQVDGFGHAPLPIHPPTLGAAGTDPQLVRLLRIALKARDSPSLLPSPYVRPW
eukprot:gene27031-18165_t